MTADNPGTSADGGRDEADDSRLQCVGSFSAYDTAEREYTIEIWTHFDSVHDRRRSRVERGMLVLKTTEGHAVDYLGQGEYQLADDPEVRLSSSDPDAP